ncbi:hypothetical protein [Nocardia sp. NPDC051570]|uniref:hypothetical protein n=1 Tax=Nocardia sp. NPDC051570 TaxID=3364324 RepID=UPI00378ED201
MTDYSAELLKDRRRRGEDARRQMIRQFTSGLPVRVVFALTGVSAYAAFATFGIEWARLAGASAWEAAVWPIAVTATTSQALYSRVRLVPGWYPSEARWLFNTVAGAGFILAMLGNGLYSGGYPHQLHPAVAVLVNGVPGLCLVLSTIMAATFVLSPRPPEPRPIPPLGSPMPATEAAAASAAE